MEIIISQQNLPAGRQDKKILITFKSGKVVDKYEVDKADDFLAAIDKFLNRRNNSLASIAKADLKFMNVGMLTERIIRAIIIGLRF